MTQGEKPSVGPTNLDDNQRSIGQTGMAVFPVALGTANFGWTLSSGAAVDVLDTFVALGGNLIDTADRYASGMSEHIIGTWMHNRQNRDHVIVATKVGLGDDFPGLSTGAIRNAVHASLERLQTDRIDLLYFHGPDPETPIVESLSAVEDLITAGKVRALGFSNFPTSTLMEARIDSSAGLPFVEACSLELSLMRPEIVPEYQPLLDAQRVSLMPYFVLAHGFLGRHRDIKDPDPEDSRLRRAGQYATRRGHEIVSRLEELAARNETDISTVALSWVLHQPAVTAAAVGVDRAEDLDSLMHAPSLTMSRVELAQLSAE